jgi:enterochelin esterase family protein
MSRPAPEPRATAASRSWIARAAAAAALLLGPLTHAAGQAVERFTIDDTTYGLQRSVWVYRSPGTSGSPAAPYNLFVFLQREYADDLAVPALLEKLAASGEIPPTIAVVLDTSTERPADIANTAKFDRFVSADLVPWLRGTLGRLPPPRNTVIAGFSVGGLAAAHVAYRHPEVFGNVLVQSGAFWRGDEGANDPPEWLTDQFRRTARLPLRFYLEVGSGETRPAPNGVGFLAANRRLRDVLEQKGYVLQYREVPRDIHDPDHLRPTLPAGIVFLSKSAQ